MGHDILRCDFCGRDVMEGHNDWDCSCGATCNYSTNYSWKMPKINSNTEDKKLKKEKNKKDNND